MTKAGARLHLTQSALSHQLGHLEEALGTALFHRSPRKMTPTAAGARLLETAKAILEQVRKAEREIRQSAMRSDGLVRVSTECYTCYHWLPARVKAFREAHPRVDIQIVVEATQHPIEALLEGKLDVAVVSRPPSNRRVAYRRLFRDELITIVAEDHPLAARSYVNPEDFAEEVLITYSLPKEEMTIYSGFLAPAGVMPRQIIQAELTEAMIEMVRAGLGVSAVARWAAAPHLGRGLKALTLGRRGFHRWWGAAYLRHPAPAPYLAAFIDTLEEMAGPHLAAGVAS
jgi:LysR family transcriptional regulator for metE and metH